MALSEHEQRVLDDIEAQLHREDPRFVERTRLTGSRRQRTHRLRLAGFGFLGGIALMAMVTFHIVWGLVGFGIMFASILVAANVARTGFRDEEGSLRQRLRQAMQPSDDGTDA